ncbi:MAG TPA: lipase maturation factor family protein [Candidatus Acidoferrales bacterium]|nr:lipase maturation factor family protein [Candidatus Acidoferrales bacterium]
MHLDYRTIPQRLFGPDAGPPGYLAARWLFLRALGLIFFSAFYSLLFQVRGLIGPDGILPARAYLDEVARVLGSARFWYAPTVFWWSASGRFLIAVMVVGLIASVLLTLNICTRGMLVVCLVAFLSFIAAAQDFASYQSDGMLLEAGFLSLFFAPSGWRPRWGRANPPSRASRYLLVWLMFRIYFESGIAKILGHDPEWRDFTAMDQYYQNGPLPTWIAWYMHQLPHAFHAATAVLTLALELVLIFAIFLPRRSRIALFFIITPWQIGIIASSNYAFLNYLVLALGFLLLDDRILAPIFPQSWRNGLALPGTTAASPVPETTTWHGQLPLLVQAIFLTWIFYATSALLILMLFPAAPLPQGPIRKLEPFRFANEFGLFAVMTRDRYELEFQGSQDGQNWVAYPFRNKPQDVHAAPRIYAPYQPRFDWNLWFASLGSWRQNRWVLRVGQRLLSGSPDVLSLFAADPFAGHPPDQVRVVLWQYWFTSGSEKRAKDLWWRREDLGLYAPTLGRSPDGKILVLEIPDARPGTQ